MNGKIVTMDSEERITRAIGIKEGKIAVIGNDDEVLSKKNP